MKKLLMLIVAGVALFAMSVPAQAVPNEIEKNCSRIYNGAGTRDVTICEALEQSTPVPPGNLFWGRVYVQNAGSGGELPPYQICCTVTMWEANTGSSNYDVASAATVLWNQGDGDQNYNTSHIDKSNLKCKIHVEAGQASPAQTLYIIWQQGNDPHYITNDQANNPDVNLVNYGDNSCP